MFRLLEEAAEEADVYSYDDDDAELTDDAEDGSSSSTFQTTEGISAYFVFFLTLLSVVLVLNKWLHDRPRLGSLLPEAGLVILVGMTAGLAVNLFFVESNALHENDFDDDSNSGSSGALAASLLSFSPKVFFVALLPPIIYNSGYHLRRELFFRHLLPISLFAIVGTMISALSTAFILDLVVNMGLTGSFKPTLSELLTFGALISSTDPVSTLAVFQTKKVDPHLFYIVFGESCLNDALCLVLFKAFSKFVVPENGAGKIITGFGAFIFSFLLDAIGSPILGVLCGCLAALLFKHVDMRTNRLLELSLYILIMYVPFLLAELIHLSGIVTILFTGMTARSFVVPNLSRSTANTAQSLFRLAAHLAETAINLELGLSVFGMTGSFEAKFTLWALLTCLISRALNVYPITVFFNRALRRKDAVSTVSPPKHGPPTKIATNRFLRSPKTSLYDDDHHEPEEMFHRPGSLRQAESDMSSMTPRKQRDLKIASKTAHMLWFSGLRGAVAYACVRSFPSTFGHQNEFAMTTMAIVLATLFLLGSTTECALKVLGIDVDVDEDKYMEEWHQQRQSDGSLLKLEAFIRRHAVRVPERNTPKSYNDRIANQNSEADGSYAMQYSQSHSFGRDVAIPAEHIDLCNYDETDHMMIWRKESLFDFGGC